jgi:hypothetical protein
MVLALIRDDIWANAAEAVQAAAAASSAGNSKLGLVLMMDDIWAKWV